MLWWEKKLEETTPNSSVVLPQRKIEQLHEAVVNGDLKSVQSHMTRRKLALSKDENGHGLLHKVVYFGHRDIYDWLAKTYPETLETRDWVRKRRKHERETQLQPFHFRTDAFPSTLQQPTLNLWQCFHSWLELALMPQLSITMTTSHSTISITRWAINQMDTTDDFSTKHYFHVKRTRSKFRHGLPSGPCSRWKGALLRLGLQGGRSKWKPALTVESSLQVRKNRQKSREKVLN